MAVACHLKAVAFHKSRCSMKQCYLKQCMPNDRVVVFVQEYVDEDDDDEEEAEKEKV